MIEVGPELPHRFVPTPSKVVVEYLGPPRRCALLRRVAEMSETDADSSGVLLTTETPDNVKYYEGRGYEVVGADQVEELRTWTLLRRDRA